MITNGISRMVDLRVLFCRKHDTISSYLIYRSGIRLLTRQRAQRVRMRKLWAPGRSWRRSWLTLGRMMMRRRRMSESWHNTVFLLELLVLIRRSSSYIRKTVDAARSVRWPCLQLTKNKQKKRWIWSVCLCPCLSLELCHSFYSPVTSPPHLFIAVLLLTLHMSTRHTFPAYLTLQLPWYDDGCDSPHREGQKRALTVTILLISLSLHWQDEIWLTLEKSLEVFSMYLLIRWYFICFEIWRNTYVFGGGGTEVLLTHRVLSSGSAMQSMRVSTFRSMLKAAYTSV